MVKILITDSVFPYNGGDSAILITMLQDLKEVIPDAKFTLLSYYPDAAAEQLNKIAEVHYPFGRLMRGFPRNYLKMFLWLVWLVTSNNWFNKFLPISTNEKETLNAYKSADIIISCGGGFITDTYALYKTLYGFLFGKLFKKPVMLYAQSIGPIRRRSYKLLVKIILNRVDLITTRDKLSEKILADLKITKPLICVTADSAIKLIPASSKRIEDIFCKEGIPKKKEKLVGISVRRWVFPESKYPDAEHNKYKEAMAELADYVISKFGTNVVFISTCAGEKSYVFNDADTAFEIVEKMEFKNKAKVIDRKYRPNEIKAMIGSMGIFIGTRMHSLIFATTMGVPSLGIEYEFKTKELMKELGQEKYLCNIQGIDFKKIKPLVDDLWANREKISYELNTKIGELERRSSLNSKLALELLYEIELISKV